jgi:hypothetical protein
MPRPIPFVEPVTIATRPVRSNSSEGCPEPGGLGTYSQ